MVDIQYSSEDYMTPKISVEAVMKNPEMLKLISDYLKTKKMCNYAVKKLLFVIRHVLYKYKIKKMCNKAILENGGTLESLPN